MQHELFEKSLEIVDSEVTFEQIYEKEFVPADYIEDIRRANMLIIPYEEYRGEDALLFPETTRDFFRFAREESGNGVDVEIVASDEDFSCLELHSAVIQMAMLIVKEAFFSIATSMVGSFLYDLVKRRRRSAEDTFAKVNIIVEETDAKRSKMITYEGPVAGVKEALDSAAVNLFS